MTLKKLYVPEMTHLPIKLILEELHLISAPK